MSSDRGLEFDEVEEVGRLEGMLARKHSGILGQVTMFGWGLPNNIFTDDVYIGWPCAFFDMGILIDFHH